MLTEILHHADLFKTQVSDLKNKGASQMYDFMKKLGC